MISFRQRVLDIVARIPEGKVMTYRDVAKRAGKANAYRAVGNILRKNYNPAVPCHRVIRSNGEAGGYNRGKERKVQLLAHEGIHLVNS